MGFSLTRTARAADAAGIFKLFQVPGSGLARLPGLPAQRLQDIAELLATLQGRFPCLVALHNEHIEGFACASAHQAAAGFRWSVDAALHVPAGPRQGRVARSLYTALLGQLAGQGVLAVYATLPASQGMAVPLHEALGFAHLAQPATFDLLGEGSQWCLTLDQPAPGAIAAPRTVMASKPGLAL